MRRFRLRAAIAGCLAGTVCPAGLEAETRAPFEDLYRQAYEDRLRKLGAEHPKTAASLVRVAALLRSHGRAVDAEQLLRTALEAQGGSDSVEDSALLELAAVLEALGKSEEAESLYVRWLETGEAGATSAKPLLRVAALREARGDAAGAREAYARALAQFDEEDPLDAGEREARASALNSLGLLLEADRRLPDAEAAYRRAAEAHAAAFGEEHPATATARANLAGMLALRGEAAAAAALLERARSVFEAAYEARHQDTANLRNRLGEIYESQGRLDEAEAEYLGALAAWAEPSTSRGLALADLGRLKGVKGEFAAAEAVLREAVEILESAPQDAAAQFAEALDSYGSVLRALDRLDQAEPMLRRALALREQALGAAHADVALTLVGLAGVLHLRGDLRAAEPLYERALRIQEQALGPDHPDVGETLYNLAHLAMGLGDVEEARKSLERSGEILANAYGPDDPFVIEIQTALRAMR